MRPLLEQQRPPCPFALLKKQMQMEPILKFELENEHARHTLFAANSIKVPGTETSCEGSMKPSSASIVCDNLIVNWYWLLRDFRVIWDVDRRAH